MEQFANLGGGTRTVAVNGSPSPSICFGFTSSTHWHCPHRLQPTNNYNYNNIPNTTITTSSRNRHFVPMMNPKHFRRLHHHSAPAPPSNATPLPSSSPWDDKPSSYELLSDGRIAAHYLDEQDVVSFLDPPKQLIPLDPSSYNPASYLWKKIEDIPEERRHRLLTLLKPRLISRAWEIAGTRYDDPKLAVKSASSLLSHGDGAMPLEFWNCRTSGGPLVIAWMKIFKKALFYSNKRKPYGRFIGGSLLEGISRSFFPLYFGVREANEVMSTEQPCDLAYEFGDGLLDLSEYPQGFPKPAKHPWPFCDQVIVYVRHLGPGVLVGQAWQEGEALEQVPKKLCGEILMIKDFCVGM